MITMGLAEIVLFPIRHHSPACAWHLGQLIAERRPRAVLIEGPHDATPLVEHLAHPALRAPVAIYTTFVDTTNRLQRSDHARANPARFAAYYPLADFSPELVAIRAGHAIGAGVRFVDLTFPQMVLAERGAQPSAQVRSLLDESYLRHSRFLQALCERTGARTRTTCGTTCTRPTSRACRPTSSCAASRPTAPCRAPTTRRNS